MPKVSLMISVKVVGSIDASSDQQRLLFSIVYDVQSSDENGVAYPYMGIMISRHFHIVFDVRILDLKLSNVHACAVDCPMTIPSSNGASNNSAQVNVVPLYSARRV